MTTETAERPFERQTARPEAGVCVVEHVNITASDARRTSDMLCEIFGWKLRWQGPAKGGGYTRHVGTDTSYVAVYQVAPGMPGPVGRESSGRLNHIAMVVPDLDAIEMRVRWLGLTPHSHADYEPGRRFYFHDHDGIEYEVVSYA